MLSAWERRLERIRRDRRSGASVLLAGGIEAARVFLAGTRRLPPGRLQAALERFTLRLTASQPSMAAFLTLANALWLACGELRGESSCWPALHDALVRYADGVDRGLRASVGQTAALIRRRSRVLTYSSKWLPQPLARFWGVREEPPGQIARPGDPNLLVHNRYFGTSPLSLVSGVVWEGGMARAVEVRRRIARLPVSGELVRLLGGRGAGECAKGEP